MRRIVLALLSACTFGTAAQAAYVIETFTAPSSPGYTNALGLNDSASIAGGVLPSSGNYASFVRKGGLTTVLSPPFPDLNTAFDINGAGTVVGQYTACTNAASCADHAYRFNGVSYSTIDFPGAHITDPWSINNAGVVAGTYSLGYGPYLGYVMNTAGFITIQVPGSSDTYVYGINDAGLMVGSYQIGGGKQHGFIYDGAVFTTVDAPGGGVVETVLRDINDAGQIVGSFSDGITGHSFVLTGSTMTEFLFPGQPPLSLNGINNLGQIVGTETNADGDLIGFLASPVPEPPVILLFALGVLGLRRGATARRASPSNFR